MNFLSFEQVNELRKVSLARIICDNFKIAEVTYFLKKNTFNLFIPFYFNGIDLTFI